AQSLGHDIAVPNAAMTDRSPGWWGSIFLLTANATFFGALLFGFAFLWTVAPGWPPPVWFAPSAVEFALGLLGAVVAPAAMHHAIRTNRRGGNPDPGLVFALIGAIALALACAILMVRTPSPMGHAYGATLFVL